MTDKHNDDEWQKQMAATPTPQNEAKAGDFAKTVLMPGDPFRAKFVAEKYFENPRLVNNIRGAQGYTGTYKGKTLSVMAHGMGCPSMGIYAHELYNFYGVDRIIRIGTAGGISERLKVGSVLAAIGASTNSEFAMSQFNVKGHLSATASFPLLKTAADYAKEAGIELVVGNFYTTDAFYDASSAALEWGKLGCLAVEMETYALYTTAAYAGKEALALCTVSDHILTGEVIDSTSNMEIYAEMLDIALETAIRAE